MNDGASAIILMEEEYAIERGIRPLARIRGYEETAVKPVDYTLGNIKAVEQLLDKLNMNLNDINFHEIHETYASVPLSYIKMLDLNPKTVNVNGGGISLGHPLGMSGNRIIISLLNTLRINNASLGWASISNGGGESSAIVIERLL